MRLTTAHKKSIEMKMVAIRFCTRWTRTVPGAFSEMIFDEIDDHRI